MSGAVVLLLCVLLAVFVLDAVGKLILLTHGNIPRRTPKHLAIDVVLNASIAAWVAVVLFGK